MGIASSLFFSSNDTEKQTLHRRITPSAEQIEEQQDRWNKLAEHLVADIKAENRPWSAHLQSSQFLRRPQPSNGAAMDSFL
jgi:hypothetical protein